MADKKYSKIDLSKYNGGYKKSNDVIEAENKQTAAEDALSNLGDYKKSDAVIAAEKKKANAENAVSNYGDFSYSNQSSFDEIMNKILNREEFSYDLNGDALYQQYKDKYIQQGKMAMQDTMGQASAMTGGYGNSYAATVGNQAYQASLENLNDIVPELYQMAYDKYNQEGQDLYNQYGMLSDDRSMEYGMWGDKYNMLVTDRGYYSSEADNAYTKDYGEWSDKKNYLLTDRDYYAGRADSEYAKDYGEWNDNRTYDTTQYWNETNYGYQKDRDAVADEQWEKSFKESQRQHNENTVTNRLKNNPTQDETEFTYVSNQKTTDFKNGLVLKSEFIDSGRGAVYNGKKYPATEDGYNDYLSAKILDKLNNGEFTEDEAYSVMQDLGL